MDDVFDENIENQDNEKKGYGLFQEIRHIDFMDLFKDGIHRRRGFFETDTHFDGLKHVIQGGQQDIAHSRLNKQGESNSHYPRNRIRNEIVFYNERF